VRPDFAINPGGGFMRVRSSPSVQDLPAAPTHALFMTLVTPNVVSWQWESYTTAHRSR
jgi:hypothetical protein